MDTQKKIKWYDNCTALDRGLFHDYFAEYRFIYDEY